MDDAEGARRVHVEVEGGRFLPVTFLGRELGEHELAEVLALLHDALPARLAALALDTKASPSPPPVLLRGDSLECVIKILPAQTQTGYTLVVRGGDGAYLPLQHAGPRVLCHVQPFGPDAPTAEPTALQRTCPGACAGATGAGAAALRSER
jgi:hypothetical protein